LYVCTAYQRPPCAWICCQFKY